ncbi:MAG: SCO family protein, partial [Acidimicrobiales bacterium]
DRLVRAGVIAGWAFCLADWVLIEDLGFFGGLGTDPNSMIPIGLLFTAGYVALIRPADPTTGASVTAEPAPSFLARAKLDPSYAFRSLAAGGAVLVTLLGAAPMALASTNPNADPIVAEAANGTPGATNTPAPNFSLVDQDGRSVSLASLRGRTIALTFLDPVSTSDGPLISQEFRQADLALGASAKATEFIAIVANPLYRSTFFTNAFDREEGLNHLSNWLYLTGSLRVLTKVWDAYGVRAPIEPAGAMIDHTEITYVIDRRGHTRYIMGADPGPGTSTTKSSYASLLDQELSSLMPS